MAKYGTGSSLQQGIQAAGGNIAQAVSGAAAPYLAEQIHILTEGNPEAKAMAHAVVGAVASYASGNRALAGAVSGELMAQLVMKALYPGKAHGNRETDHQRTGHAGGGSGGRPGRRQRGQRGDGRSGREECC